MSEVKSNRAWRLECEALRAEITNQAREIEKLLAALRAMNRLLDRDFSIVFSDIVLRCESHDQAWNYLHEAREIIKSALAAKGDV